MDLDQLLRSSILAIWLQLFLCISFSIFLLHPGRFSVIDIKTISEDDIRESISKYTSKPAGYENTVQDPVHQLSFLESQASNFSMSNPPTILPLTTCSPGGSCFPKNTTVTLPLVTLVIPYRARPSHLAIFLPYMHTFLQMQGLNYTIILVEQEEGPSFNRAKLLNIGFIETIKLFPLADCFIFHDVDLIPITSDNHYLCFPLPRHMTSSLNEFRYNLPYQEMVGGGLAISRSHFLKVNGFSNRFYGWGGEDDEFYQRLSQHHLHPARLPAHQARYISLKHIKQALPPDRATYPATHPGSVAGEGLTTLEYQRKDITLLPMCTVIRVVCDV